MSVNDLSTLSKQGVAFSDSLSIEDSNYLQRIQADAFLIQTSSAYSNANALSDQTLVAWERISENSPYLAGILERLDAKLFLDALSFAGHSSSEAGEVIQEYKRLADSAGGNAKSFIINGIPKQKQKIIPTDIEHINKHINPPISVLRDRFGKPFKTFSADTVAGVCCFSGYVFAGVGIALTVAGAVEENPGLAVGGAGLALGGAAMVIGCC
jgi:hypothetical protein